MRRFSKRKRKVKRALRKIKAVWIIKIILYGLGIYSFFYSEKEYTITLVSFQTIVIIGLVTGTIASLVIERQFKYYLFSIILLGSLTTAVLFRFNRTFQHVAESKIKLRILYKELKSPKTDVSRVTVEYNDFNKDIQLDPEQEYLMPSAAFVVLTVHKGALGYNVITYRQLADN